MADDGTTCSLSVDNDLPQSASHGVLLEVSVSTCRSDYPDLASVRNP